MITMQSYKQSDSFNLLADINKEDSILIIGQGRNESYLNEFIKPKNLHDMKTKYGMSDLTTAYETAFELGSRNIYVMNCHKTTDYIDSISFASNYNFAYIVPIGIKFSDKFYSIEYDKDMYFAEYYLNEFGRYTNSLILFTDEHASLYKDIDHYLNDMHMKTDALKEQSHYILEKHGRNLAFCLNNIKYNNHANVVLASLLSSCKIGRYPDSFKREAIFDIDFEDIFLDEIIYFKNNFHIGATIENLKNFRTINDANKLIAIDRVIKHIERTLDTSFVVGKLYNQYVKMNLHDYIDMFFRGLLGSVIKNYKIKEIKFIAGINMTGHMTVDIDIFPINSLEQVSALLEVR